MTGQLAALLLHTPERGLLERAALLAICACHYYELADCLGEMSDSELEAIIERPAACPTCDATALSGC